MLYDRRCISLLKIFIAGCDRLSYGAFTTEYLCRADKFFFHRYVMPVAYSGIHERQKGVRDRHENDPRRVHPLADLRYHMVLRHLQLEREIDVENISPFNTSLSLSSRPVISFPLSRSLSHSFFSSPRRTCERAHAGICAAQPALCSRSFFTLRAATRERAYALFARTLSERDFTRQCPFICADFSIFSHPHTLCHRADVFVHSRARAHRLYFIF